MQRPPPDKESGRRLFGRRLIQAGLLLLCAAIAFYFILLPPLVERSLNRRLRQLGFDSSPLQVENLTLRNLHLGSFTLGGSNALQVASMDAEWRIDRLLQGRVSSLTFAGAQWRIDATKGAPDFAPFDRLFGASRNTKNEATTPGPWQLPMDRLEITASTILLELPGETVVIPVDATLRGQAGTIHATVKARFGGRSYRVHADFESSRESLKASIQAFRKPVAYAGSKTPLLQCDFHRHFAKSILDLQLAGQVVEPLQIGWGESPLVVERGNLDLDMTLGPKRRFATLMGEAEVAGIRYGGLQLSSIAMSLERREEVVRFSANAEGRSWHLRELQLDLPNEPARWLSAPTRVPLRLSFLPVPKKGSTGMLDALNLHTEGLKPIDIRGDLVYLREPPTGPDPAEPKAASSRVEIRNAHLFGHADRIWRGDSKARLEGCTLSLAATGRVDTKGIELRLLPGSQLITDAVGPSEPKKADSKPSGTNDAPAAFRVRLADAGQIKWGLSDTEKSGWDLSLPDVAIAVDAGGLDATALPVRQASAEGRMSVEMALNEQGTRYSVQVESSKALKLTANAVSAEISGLGVDIRGAISTDAAPTLPEQLFVRAAECRIMPYKTSLTDFELRLKRKRSEETQENVAGPPTNDGSLVIGGVQVRNRALPGLSLALSRAQTNELHWEGSWDVTPTAQIGLEGEIAIGPPGVAGRARVQASPFQLKKGDRLTTLFTESANVDVSGALEGDLTLAYSSSGIESSGSLAGHDLTVSDTDDAYSISGINTTIRLDSLFPPQTPRGQHLTWKSASAGEFELRSGQIAFQVADLESLVVEHAEWQMGDRTQFWLQAFQTNPFRPTINTQLFCEHLDLNQWLSLATKGQAKGEGSLNGRIRFRFQNQPDPKLTLQDGFLYAAGEGSIQVTDTKLAKQVLEQQASLPKSKGKTDYNQIIRERILKSVQHFDYSTLTFDLIPKGDALTMTVHAKGQGRDVPQSLDLTLNFHGIDKLISLAIGLKLGLQ